MKKVFIIAGEASGDFLGASLMRDLNKLHQGKIEYRGIGGSLMQAEGLQSLFPMEDLSVMGISEVVKHLPLLLKRLKQTEKKILEEQPDLLMTVDSPDFCLRIAKKIKHKNQAINVIHYVAPTVWAWRPGRAKKIAGFLDGLLCLFPFEPPYFTKHNLKAAFVGHPLTKIVRQPSEVEKISFYQRHGLDPAKPILCLLPGSRHREIDTLLPVFLETAKRLRRTIKDLQIILPTLGHLQDKIASAVQGHDIHVFLPQDVQEKYTAFSVSRAALHASGTVALELALCNTPMVTAYILSPVSTWIGKKLVKTPYANLVNILLQRPVVPEMLNEQATADQMTPVIQALLTASVIHQMQQEELRIIAGRLNENAPLAAAHFAESFLNS